MEQEGEEKRVERSSPSNTSSQGDMADTEMEAGPSRPSETPTNEQPPPKKKRTRTLTTPHQSAVLHALLAQSRFPTTAMREEVGRSIGLSARKVQIWFQNQRQKARRPRGDSAAAVTRPPQYGPFPNALPFAMSEASMEGGPSAQLLPMSLRDPSSSALTALSYGGTGAGAFASTEGASRREDRVPEGYARSQLSGPGIPGPSSRRVPSLRTEEPQVMTSMTLESRSVRFSPVRTFSPSRRSLLSGDPLDLYSSRSARPSARLNDPGAHEPSSSALTLPPILPEASLDPAGISSASSSIRYPSTSNQPEPRLPQILHVPDTVSHQYPHIPPPFTLEPQPQWDDPAFSPFSRPGTTRSPPRPRTSYEFSPVSSSPPSLSAELRARDAAGAVPPLRDPASMQGPVPGHPPAATALPSPLTLLESMWPTRRSDPTDPRGSRRGSIHSDDLENDPNVTRSR